jgi:Flp pilus assembly protein TadG
MSGRRSAHANGRRGQALAEFAIVLPLILLFIAAILEFGRAWNIKQAVTDAAREGARYTVVMDNTLTIADVEHKIRERLALSNIDTTTSTIVISSPDPFCSPITVCFHDPNGNGTGREMTVSVATQHRMPLVHVLLKWAGVPSTVTINTDATMRGE